MTSDLTLNYTVDAPYNAATTLSVLSLGPGDPCFHLDEPANVRLALSCHQGPLTVAVSSKGDDVNVECIGPDAQWLAPLVPDLLGLSFRPPRIDGPPRLRKLAQKFAGMRLPRMPILFSRLTQIVLQQLVSFEDARYSWRMLVRRYGTPISGQEDLIAPPTASVVARLASHEFVECGVLPQHGRRLIGLAREARRIEATWGGGAAADAMERTCQLLARQRGVGPWTIGYLRGAGMGDSDALVLKDYGFPKRVAYFFNGAEEADDDEMVRLLEPYCPHRFYVLLLLLKGAQIPPRRGPRRERLRDRLHPRSEA